MIELELGPVIACSFRIVLYAAVLALGWRFRRSYWAVGAACALAIGSNAALLAGDLFVSGLLAIPFATLNAWIYLERMRQDPEALRVLMAARQAEWSKEMHNLRNDYAQAQAEATMWRRRAQQD